MVANIILILICLICWHFLTIILFSCSFCLLSQLIYLFIWSGFWFSHAGLGTVMTIAFVIRGLWLRVEHSCRRRIGFSFRSECWRIKRQLRSVILPRHRFASFSPLPLLMSYIINELPCFSPGKWFQCKFKHFSLTVEGFVLPLMKGGNFLQTHWTLLSLPWTELLELHFLQSF